MSISEQILRIKKKISGTPIIVEGKKDKIALSKLGFENIIAISGKSNEKLLNALKTRQIRLIIILTDFDKEGEEKQKELCRLFEKRGIKIDFLIRNRFKKIFKINKIEELSSLAKLVDVPSNSPYQINDKILNKKKFLRRKYKRKKN